MKVTTNKMNKRKVIEIKIFTFWVEKKLIFFNEK